VENALATVLHRRSQRELDVVAHHQSDHEDEAERADAGGRLQEHRGRLELVGWSELWGVLEAGADLFDPTLAGWCRWVKVWEHERARQKPRLKLAEGRAVARFWWGRKPQQA
jgi:hypothetical protein